MAALQWYSFSGQYFPEDGKINISHVGKVSAEDHFESKPFSAFPNNYGCMLTFL